MATMKISTLARILLRFNRVSVENIIKSVPEPNPILIVDDEEDMCLMVQSTLELNGIPSIAVNSGEDALKALKRRAFALVLLDWGLRGAMDTSGAKVLRVCKETYPLMPVIVMSGLPFDWRTDAAVGQADSFLQKPFNSTLLTGTVNQWLNRLRQTPKVFLPQSEEEILTLDKIKNIYICHVVKLLNGNVSLAAAKLGIHRQTVATAVEGGD